MLPESDVPLHATYPFGLRSTRPVELALLIVIACAAVTGIAIDLVRPEPGPGILPIAVAVIGVGVAWRWRSVGTGILLAAPLAAGAVGRSDVVTWSIVALAVLMLTMRGAKSRFIAPLAALCAYAGEALANVDGFVSGGALAALGVTFAAAASGSAAREHFRFLHSVEQRAAEAIRTRTMESSRRVTEEKLRIARDLHDVVGHQVAVVNMQIGMAEVALPDGAERSRAALRAARGGVQTILKESQRILTVLRIGEADGEDREPAPTLRQLGELIASYRAIGAEIESHIGALPDDADPGVQTTAYRVLQEALTNAHRHGTGAIGVDVDANARAIAIRVTNRRAATPSDEGSGYGLVGTRERVQSVGGTLDIEKSDAQFVLTTILPLHGTETP